MLGRRFVACLSAVATVATVAAIRPVVAAADPPDPAATAIAQFLSGASNSIQSWSTGLGQLGKLADALPAVQTSPGAALGFDDLLDKAFTTSGLSSAVNDATLEMDKDIDFGGSDGRSGHFTSHVTNDSVGKHDTVTVHITRDVIDQPLSIAVPIGGGSNAPQSAFTSQGGIKLTVTADLTFEAVYETATGKVFLKVNSGTPSLKVGAHAQIGTASGVAASVGILGVALANDSTLDVQANFLGSVNDPNNDGKLYFDDPSGNPGELAQKGSLAGLVNFGFDNPAGHLNASLHLTATSNSSFSLPAVDATLGVSWPDISTGTPSVTFPDASIGQFLNMTPRDLAAGIAQLVTSLTSIQNAKSKTIANFGNINLPFIKGTLADAVKVNESLQTFLDDWTYPGPSDPNFNHTANEHHPGPADDPAKAGEPKFTSLQTFIDKLNTVLSGTGGGVSAVGFDNDDPSTHKLHFTLSLHHAAPADPVNLNGASAAASGPASSAGHPANTTYSATGLTDPNQDWVTNEFAGRQVVAGNSAGTIESNDAHSITLAKNVDNSYWSPAVPAANQPYSISGMQGDVGQVQLGNALQTPDADAGKPGHGVSNANAVNATAKVTPSFDASVTLVLDLTPPVIHDPPIQKTNPDGSSVLVSSEPTGADRVLLRTGNTPLFTADFPIDASADIFANAGFLQVRLKGAVHVCEKDITSSDCSGSPPNGKHMVEVDLKDKGDITFGQLVGYLLDDPTQLIDYHVAVRAVGSVTASIPQASAFFGGNDPEVGFHWDDLTQLDPNNADGPHVDFSALSKLANVDFDPSNPRALFSIILKTLQTLDSVIGSAPTTEPFKSIFTKPIPVIGRSLGQLLAADESGGGDGVTFDHNTLTDNTRSTDTHNAFDPTVLMGRSIVVGTQVGIITGVTDNTLTMATDWQTKPANGSTYVVRSQLDDAISILENSPSDNLQALTKVLNDRLGHDSPITFEYADGANVGNTPSIIIDLKWHREYHTSSPIQFDFNLGGDTHSLAGVQGAGSVSLGVDGDITMGLVVHLQPGDGPSGADQLQVLDNSGINLHLNAEAHGSLTTTIGPLSLSLGNPDDSAPADQKINAVAHYGLGLGKSGASGDAENFSTFIGEVGATVNDDANTDDADCGFTGGTVALSMCADLPLYVKGNSGWDKLIKTAGKSNDFAIRLPKHPQNGADITDVINPLGGDIDGHKRIETPDPTEFATALANATLDLTRIDGIDSFLNALQNALIGASFGGKLPLIGDDIQQGADFIGKLKAQIDAVLGDLASVNSTQGLTDWLNKNLKKGLADNGFNPDAVTVDITCTDKLNSVTNTAVDVVNAGDAASTTYTYVVASYIKNSSGAVEQAKVGDPGITHTGPAFAGDGVSPSKPLKITWDAVTGAAGYLVFRKDGSDFKQIADVQTNEATDDGTATPGDGPANPADNPHLHDCSLTGFDSFIIRVDVSQGNFSGDYLNCDNAPAGHECLTPANIPLNIGLPGLSIRSADGGGNMNVQLGWRLHLAFGISKTDGFFVDTKDGDPQPELAVGLNFALPSHLTAQLAIIDVDVSNCTNDDTKNCDSTAPDAGNVPPLFGGSFKLDLISPHSDGRLTLADLGSGNVSDYIVPTLTAGVNIDWLLKATVDSGAGFPGIQADFQLHWAWSNAAPGSGASGLDISFKKVQISAGKILGAVIGPIIQQIKKVTDPLQPVIKTLYAPIPVLSDLSHLVGGDDVTLVSIAKAFSTLAGGPDLTFVDRVVQVVKLVSSLPVGDDDVLIPIGSFDLTGSTAVNTTATPDNTESLIKNGSKQLSPDASSDTSLLNKLDSDTTGGTKVLNTKDGNGKTESEKAGFSFPVFQHPASLFNLLLGGDVDLVKFDSGPLTLGFDWRQEFGPVYAPPPVLITLHGSASVTLHIVAGFDTYGIRKAIEKVRDGTFQAGDVGDAILQSLFFYTTDESGKPIPVVQFNGEIAAGAEVSAVIITVGIEGGVGLTVSFLWNDPNHDGKFRISEFLKVALNNPICLFSVSGRIYVFLKLFVKIGFGPFSVSFSFTIVDVTLLDFSATPNCDPPPPKLGGLGDGGKTLVVYAATLGTTAYRGDPAWDSGSEDKETIKVTSLHDYKQPGNPFIGVAVEMLGIRNEFLNSNIERVVVDGHTYNKPMTVTFLGDGKEDTARTGPKPPTANFEKDAIVFGGSAADKIKTGIGNSYVDGGGGDDAIATGDRTVSVQDPNTHQWSYVNPNAKAWVAGGDGADSITVGNGNDRVSGDGSLGYTPVDVTGVLELKNSKNASENVSSGDPNVSRGNIAIPDQSKFNEPSGDETGLPANNDVLSTGLGASKVFGNGGDDTLSATPDNDLLKTIPASDTAQRALFHSAGATLVGGTGNDNLAGGAGDDTLITGPDAGSLDTNPDATGGSDDGSINVVDTGTGTDKVYGSTGVDRVTGHSNPDQADNIRGGAGDDILIGGYGQDTVFGGPDDDYVIAEPSTVDIPSGTPPADGIYGPLLTVTHTPLPDGTSASSKTLVGGTGNDHIIGGDGGAKIDGDGYNPSVRCGDHTAGWQTASDPVDESVNTPQDGNDKIIGGAGVENVRAGGGNDLVDVKGANDLACGESGADVLNGGSEDDTLWGGSGADVENGDAGADSVYGNDGGDALYGGAGNDTIEGNAGSDYASGGDDNDLVVGGTRFAGRGDVGDFLYGDSGLDTIVGDNVTFPGGVLRVEDLLAGDGSLGGADWIYGGANADSLYGGLDSDHIYGGDGPDYIEGNNAQDTIFGEGGADNILGGSAQQIGGATMPDAGDTISGGTEDDVILGDNGSIDGSSLDPVLTNRGLTRDRHVVLYDTGNSGAVDGTKSGNDVIDGNDGPDAIFGEGGQDTIHGDAAGSVAAFDDYVEGGQDSDHLYGDGGQDDLVGGSYHAEPNGAGDYDVNDVISGGPGGDVVLGDNGLLTRIVAGASKLTKGRFDADGGAPLTLRSIDPYDQGDSPVAGTSGGDLITGDDGGDVILGQNGNDRIQGNGDSDYIEGDSGRDWIEGNGGADDLVGGSTYTGGGVPAGQGQLDGVDVIFGGGGDDLELGDNAIVNRIDAPNPLTRRIDNVGAPIPARAFTLLDLAPGAGPNNAPTRAVYGGDLLSGGGGTDVLLGQDGDDQISGGAHDDYAEGNGGTDTIWGDNLLAPGLISAAQAAASTGAPNGLPAGPSDPQDESSPNGQDDLMGGSSIQGFRDTSDFLHGDGGADYELGDNGTIVRDVLDSHGTVLGANADLSAASGPLTNRVYTKRYAPTLPLGAAYVRHGDPNLAPSTRFCVASGSTCEPATASGGDSIWGDAGDDTLYGQDGNDLMYGDNGATGGASDGDSMVLTVDSTNDDDMYGELGDDRMWGEAGDDAMLGDRGGVVDQYENGNRAYSIDVTQVPKVHYDGFVAGTVTRQTDLQHDVNGDAFVGSSTSAKMPHPGDVEGGNDRIRAGRDEDFVHAGFGDDLVNGDSGGDTVFGDDGADLLWGGKGCDASIDSQASAPDCYPGGTFDPNARGTNDRKLDYLIGGKGATTGPSVDPKTGIFGSDILDWHPRGQYGTPDQPTTCTSGLYPTTFGNGKSNNPLVTIDPCVWFEMTNLDDADVSNNQHHQGIDWMYGGWDRDVLQGDVADNGPNAGDRLLDWNGTYNLYTHCNSAYGGYNDVRQHSPSWQAFLQQWVFSLGAGQVSSDSANGSAGIGTSAFDELALVYPGGDNAHGSGSAFPSTPGHFDDPNACAP